MALLTVTSTSTTPPERRVCLILLSGNQWSRSFDGGSWEGHEDAIVATGISAPKHVISSWWWLASWGVGKMQRISSNSRNSHLYAAVHLQNYQGSINKYFFQIVFNCTQRDVLETWFLPGNCVVRVSSVGLNPTDWKHVGNNMLLGIIGCQGMGPENLNEDRPS